MSSGAVWVASHLRDILGQSNRDLRVGMELLSQDQRNRLLAALLVSTHKQHAIRKIELLREDGADGMNWECACGSTGTCPNLRAPEVLATHLAGL